MDFPTLIPCGKMAVIRSTIHEIRENLAFSRLRFERFTNVLVH